MPKSNNDKKNVKAFKRIARISVRACCLVNPRPTSPPYQNLSPPTDYQTALPTNLIDPLRPSLIASPGFSLDHLLNTPKSTPPPLTSPLPAPSQTSKHNSSLAINLELVELICSTPPTSPHPFFVSLEDLPPRTTNPPPPQPSFIPSSSGPLSQSWLDQQLLMQKTIVARMYELGMIPVVYLQQFQKTVSKVHDIKDTIEFKLDSQEITYIVDMFRDTLKLLVETPDNPFIAPVNIKVIESFTQTVGYQGVVEKVSAFYTKFLAQPWQTIFKVFSRCLTTRTSGHDQTKINILQLFHAVVNRTNVDYVSLLRWDFLNCVFQKKDVIQYHRFTKLIIAHLMKKFPSIPQRLDEDYHYIKDDIPLVSVYSTRNVLFRGILISYAFLTDEIRATDDYKEYETVFVEVEFPMNQPQLVVSTQGTHRTTPRAHRMVKGEEDEESYASTFVDSMLNDDVDDSGTRIEPGSHKENLEVVDDDAMKDKEKQDEKKEDDDQPKDDDVKKTDDATEKKDNDDHTDHTLFGTHATVKSIYEETATVSPTTATTSKPKSTRGFISNKTKVLPGSIDGMCRRRGQIRNHNKTKFVTHEFFMGKIRKVLDYCSNIVPKITFAKTNEMIKEEMHRLDVDPPEGGETSEKIKINLTAPTLTFSGIKAHESYSIVDKPDTGLIYLNSKDEKRVIYLVEIVKVCDATLKKVLNEVKLRIFQNKFWKKPPLLGELDLDILKAYEREITKRLRHREQMRRWESFVNER
uniref:Uncharacterized protein n=1 Tax=Tanacetum cinerariifolium TaxID=118510 RepID=A0A699GJT7_TANCI|nr:hypothetical protein [Tanacetum cinerariifolium]